MRSVSPEPVAETTEPPQVLSVGTAGDDVLVGSDAMDFMYGEGGDDIMRGGAFNDVLTGGLGNDVYDGGPGVDTAFFYYSQQSIRVDLALKSSQNTGEGFDTFIDIENVYGTTFNDIIIGDEIKNSLSGSDGDDTLYGKGGDDLLGGDKGNDEIHGGPGNDTMLDSDGDDFIYGDSGDDIIVVGFGTDPYELNGHDFIDGGDGRDYLSFFSNTGVNVDLEAGSQEIRPGLFLNIVNVEDIQGTQFSDRLLGDKFDNLFQGDGGSDFVDGRGGFDIYRIGTHLNELQITWTGDGWLIVITQPRIGLPTGTITLRNIEWLQSGFGENRALGDGMEFISSNILRLQGYSAQVYGATLSAALEKGTLTASTALAQVVGSAASTTSVATLSYQFFTGRIPSEAGIDYLVAETGQNANNLNSAYYQKFNIENRYINFAVNLGKYGEGKEIFAQNYGNLTLLEAAREAYKAIFGATPTEAKTHALIDDRASYFAAYGGDGVNGQGTKAAMVGWLLSEAEKAGVGVMARSNNAWLTDLGEGSASFGISLLDPTKGYYKSDFIFGGG